MDWRVLLGCSEANRSKEGELCLEKVRVSCRTGGGESVSTLLFFCSMINLFPFSFHSAFRFPCPQHSPSTVLLIMTVARMHTPSQQASHTGTFSVLYCSVCLTCVSDFAPAHKPMNCGKTHSYTHACKGRCLRVFSTRLLHTRVCGPGFHFEPRGHAMWFIQGRMHDVFLENT